MTDIKFYLYFIFLLCPWLMQGQVLVCDGNLGENIFTEGDFGSGQANIPTDDPGIAPGYLYTTNPPPPDGYYCLTNNIEVWNQVWGWLEIGDNSNDPLGYMMVVNASFDEGLFYEELVEGLCENTIYKFSVDVINLHLNNNIILPNLTFLIDDFAAYGTGDIDDDGEWKTHSFVFKTDPGQTSVKLSLRNNAPGGIGNDLALDNIRFQACGPEALILPTTVENICEDGQATTLEATINGDQFDSPFFQWQESFDGGISWVDIPGANSSSFLFDKLVSGNYLYRYLLANEEQNLSNSKCYVISNIKEVQVIPKFTDFTDTICEGLEAIFGGNPYSVSGAYIDTFSNFLGCDSIVTMHLEVLDDPGMIPIYDAISPSCWNSEDGILTVEGAQGGFDPFLFLLDGVGAQNGEFQNLASGNYSLYVEDRFGCSVETEITIQSGEIVELDIGEDLIIELGELVNLSSITNLTNAGYYWSENGDVVCLDCPSIQFLPSQSGWTWLTIESESGCQATDSVYIEVRVNRDVYVPNIFTPNGDQINDRWGLYAYSKGIETINYFRVYDRWGNLLFDAKDYHPDVENKLWDGSFHGQAVQTGVYSYIAEIVYIDGELKKLSGSVTLSR